MLKLLHLLKKKEKEGITIIQHGDVEKLRTAFQDGRIQALEELIGIYQDSNQSYDVRLAAGESLAETHHPNALNAIAETVASSAAIDLSFMEFSIDLLAKFQISLTRMRSQERNESRY